MNSCIFSFYIGDKEASYSELPVANRFGRYTVYTDSRTPFEIAESEGRLCAVFGYATDVTADERGGIVEKILSATSTLSEVVEYEARLGGKYVLLYKDNEGYFIIGDATCSLPVYFSTAPNRFICTSNPKYIFDELGLVPDDELLRVRRSGDISQAMPYDVTEYKEIKQLIPNHVLSVDRQAAKRFVNCKIKQRAVSAEDAARITAPMIERLASFYAEKFKLYCPITSGRDSRVVLAFLSSALNTLGAYTIKHPNHKGDEDDLVLPRELCELIGVAYNQIEDETDLDGASEKMNALLGEGRYSPRTLMIAHTIKKNYGDGAVVNGDIIGQVGKCSLHRDIPSIFATAGYFRCKLHNYSTESKRLLRDWLRGIRKSDERVNTFDLFSIENRQGRWAAQENLIYNLIGQPYLNIFNSRSIIYVWTAIPRRARKKSELHISLIKSKRRELLGLRFESDNSMLVRLSKSSGLAYYASSYAKYYLQRREFFRREK